MKKRLLDLVNSGTDAIIDICSDISARIQNKKVAQQKMLMIQQAQYILQNMQGDIFEVMHQNHYANVQAINVPSNIRPLRFKYNVKTGIVYYYTVAKINGDVIVPAVLNVLMSNINTDIASVSSSLYATWGAYGFQCNYPYLSAGLYAVEIKDMGTDIEIGFQTN